MNNNTVKDPRSVKIPEKERLNATSKAPVARTSRERQKGRNLGLRDSVERHVRIVNGMRPPMIPPMFGSPKIEAYRANPARPRCHSMPSTPLGAQFTDPVNSCIGPVRARRPVISSANLRIERQSSAERMKRGITITGKKNTVRRISSLRLRSKSYPDRMTVKT
jgi:hypothetical protein